MDALDKVCREVQNDENAEVKFLKKEHPRKPSRSWKDIPITVEIYEACEACEAATEAEEIPSTYLFSQEGT